MIFIKDFRRDDDIEEYRLFENDGYVEITLGRGRDGIVNTDREQTVCKYRLMVK